MSLKPEFVALLRNNDIPSESTIREVKESLKAPLIELQEIEIEIQRLYELVETTKIKRKTIQKRIDDLNIILSPVRRLPPDVLHEIFFHCLPTHRNPIMSSSESPVLLTQICSSWRAIALSSPRIWSKIHIPLPGDPSWIPGSGQTSDENKLSRRYLRIAGILQLRCDAVRRWLSRSGTCPLSISIYYPSPDSGRQNTKVDELYHEMFNILLSFADRWSDVDLDMPDDIRSQLQVNTQPTTFSSLKSLKLNGDFHSNPESPPIGLLAAPSLCSITIRGIQMTYDMTRKLVQPVWNRLTHITITSGTIDICLVFLLRQCPNLIVGNFMDIRRQWSVLPVLDQEDIFLPCLESLAVKDYSSHETMSIIFNAIKAPALTKLSYQWTTSKHYDDSNIPLPAPMIPLLSNSTLISHLILDGELSSQDIQECLRGERVTHLVFGKPPPPDTYYPPLVEQDLERPDIFDLKLLSIGSSLVAPFPRLDSLEVYNLASLTDEDLLDVIISRINAFKRGEIAALNFLKIYFHRPMQKDITGEVSRLAKEAGVEMQLDLAYAPLCPRFFDLLSPSFGLTLNDSIWSSEIIF